MLLNPRVIEALTLAAGAASPGETLRALSDARDLLGPQAAECEPLFNELTRRCDELQRLRDLAGRDPLTGAANRRTFEEELAREVARHRRTREAFAVIVLDLDGLKQRNDGCGHHAGDAALIELVQACTRTVRETDVVARLGGDEFAVLVPGSNQAGAEALAQRLRDAIEQCHAEGGPLRVSVGVAAAEYGHTSADAIVQAADQELYRDKAVRKRPEPGYQAA